MPMSVRVAFVAGLLAAAAFPVTFHHDALAQSSGAGSAGGSSSGGSGSAGGTGGASGTGTQGSGTQGSGTQGSGTQGSGTNRTGGGDANTQRSLPGSSTTGTPSNRANAPAAQRAAPTSPMARVNSQDYVDSIGSSDMFEIASSQLALERSTNQRVKDFARKMVDDHQQASQKITQAISSGGASLRAPSQMTAEHQRMLERLRSAKQGTAFDRLYLDMQVRGHERALAFHRAYANTGDNAALQGTARELAPVVQQHLTEVRRIAASDRGNTRKQGEREKRGSGS